MATPEVERTSDGLVGRERECAALDRLLEASAGSETGCVVLRGAAGIGKTALLTRERARARNAALFDVVVLDGVAE